MDKSGIAEMMAFLSSFFYKFDHFQTQCDDQFPSLVIVS